MTLFEASAAQVKVPLALIWTTPMAAPIFTLQVVTSEKVMRVVPTKVLC